ncbi:RagB/SusD family nutrient uptake outer membrane protein [Fibrivirga algicola]|uniref:RagB/SusD family nutrient uptake outer membrane protein n=1 Tax=Fibrivirga algicola TaxID=2950420 RepID=A0ABX0QDN1_9BACT|nr:RagB/SusD family nutrient uptake outer membrane protein [Fibrivirga algicola]NID09202.1 RagB/SusD family nutrient uptake outer membrane protein [Fibrivirga algicola]
MKLNHLIVGLVLALFMPGLYGCKNDFLTEQPKDFLSPTNFYQTEADATAALIATYSSLRAIYSQNFYFVGDLPSEQTNPGTGNNIDRTNIDNFLFEPTNTITTGIWNDSYVTINRANVVIARLPGISMNADRKNAIVAEAKFLRALSYFNLVRIYGGVPLRLQETASLEGLDVARSPVADVYALIIADLKEAEAALPNQQTGATLGRASKGAASALLAYVYLTKKDWANAAAKSQEVIDKASTYGYSLFTNPADIWKVENKNKQEHIFMCQYQAGAEGLGSAYNHFFTSRSANAILVGGSGFAIHLVEDAFWKSFTAGDARRDASILSSFTDPKTLKVISYPSTALAELSIFKYYDPAPFTRSNNNNNYPLLRFADVLLINAEALNESAGPNAQAYESVNKIRRRAKLADLTAGLTQQQFRDAVLRERSLEFCFESKRYFDLIRTETLIPVMTAAGKKPLPRNLLFPIPQREIDINNLIEQADQNPGY